MELVFTLLICFQIKHFMADYILQVPFNFLLGKFKDDWGFFFPLLIHSVIHGYFTLVICLSVKPELWWLCFVDIILHFMMDRIKAGKKYLGRFESLSKNEMKNILSYKDTIGLEKFKKELKGNRYFWYSLGVDQMCHHLIHYFIIFMLVK